MEQGNFTVLKSGEWADICITLNLDPRSNVRTVVYKIKEYQRVIMVLRSQHTQPEAGECKHERQAMYTLGVHECVDCGKTITER